MSKRLGNVVNPDSVIKEYGADALRVFEMFMGPFTQNIAWNTAGVIGSYKFLEKIWKLQEKVVAEDSAADKIKIALNKTIKKVTEDIENFKFNTAISSLMVMANEFEAGKAISKEDYLKFLILVAPFAPHITEELYQLISPSANSIHLENWPVYQAKYLFDEMASIVVQVNGKLRDTILVKRDEIGEQKEIEEAAKHAPKVSKYIENQQIRKVIYVEGKLINFVVGE
jgi:leucyl-tRNA synthetase